MVLPLSSDDVPDKSVRSGRSAAEDSERSLTLRVYCLDGAETTATGRYALASPVSHRHPRPPDQSRALVHWGAVPDHASVRIAHVIARLNDGGPARVLAALAQGLRAAGHDTAIFAGVTADDEPDLTAALRTAGCAVITIPCLGRRVSLADDVRAWWHLRAALAQWQPDLIHTHTTKAGVLGRLIARSLGVAMLHTFHGHVLRGYFPRWLTPVLAAVERTLAHGCALQALTASQATELRDRWRIGRRWRWRVLPIPVAPASRAAIAPRTVPVVGFLGRLVPIKDGDLWLDTLAEVARRQNVHGVICGDGGERERLQMRAQRLGLTVTFTGFVPTAQALAAMDALLMTSRNEGLPLAAIEAASVAVPVVAPPVGGLSDAIASGLVRGAARNASDLATAVQAALADGADPRAQTQALALAPERLLPRYVAWYEAIYRHHARVRRPVIERHLRQ